MQTIEDVPNDQNYIDLKDCPILKNTRIENWHSAMLVLGKS